MPVGIPLQAVPNQSLTTTLNGNLFDLAVRECNGVMTVSINLNGADIIDNLIAAACAPIIPSRYEEAGNFMFLTANNQVPYYTRFGVNQQLLYFTASELATFRVRPVAASPQVPTMTAASFNPVGQLPLRFRPQGYA